VPLTERGRDEARRVGERLSGRRFELVLTSPLARALDTCRLAGLAAQAETRDELQEWDYGAYEGLTTAEIQVEHPGWTIWTGEVPGGETIVEVAARADRVLDVTLELTASPAGAETIMRELLARFGAVAEDAPSFYLLQPTVFAYLSHLHRQGLIEHSVRDGLSLWRRR
jgi:probable phosphoglycerate mutase